ncbi:MAG: putative nucleic acid-binding protein, partial [Candidatus Latescibacterota bacterium]
VLQGFRSDKDYKLAKEILTELPIYQIVTPELALVSADNYRKLKKKGITIRKSVDNWIATFCIENKIPLLFSDKDFNPYVEHLGLRKP